MLLFPRFQNQPNLTVEFNLNAHQLTHTLGTSTAMNACGSTASPSQLAIAIPNVGARLVPSTDPARHWRLPCSQGQLTGNGYDWWCTNRGSEALLQRDRS